MMAVFSASIPRQSADGLVERAMQNKPVPGFKGSDHSPVDAVVRAYKDGDAAQKKAVGEAVSGWAKSGTVVQKGHALHFFSIARDAPGGEVLAALATSDADGYASTTPNPEQGLLGDTMREALLYAAARWNSGKAVNKSLLDVIHEDILTGDGGVLLPIAAEESSAWFTKNLQTILSLYPTDVGPVWLALVDGGATVEAAATRVLKHANAKGRESLSAFIRYNRDVTAPQKKTLLAMFE